MRAPHLAVSISAHGYGHVAQTAPVLNALHRQLPDLRITVRSAAPLAHLRSRIHVPFEHLPSEGDIGMVMASAVDILAEESRKAYRAFHADWATRVAGEAHLLRELGADMVLSNAGCLPLAGAQQAGIPNAALCSLNWFEIYRCYCGDDAVAAQMHASYARADAFLRIEPGLAMDYFPNIVPVAPIAATGRNRRDELDRHLGLSKEERLVLISLGGIASRLPMELWPRMDGVRWLVQENWRVGRADAIVLESLPLDFCDLLASSDALICKPGYGSFVESACSGVPILYSSRPDWPETPVLSAWLQRNAVCREIPRQTLEQGNIASDLEQLWQAPRKPVPRATGAEQAAEWLAGKCGRELPAAQCW